MFMQSMLGDALRDFVASAVECDHREATTKQRFLTRACAFLKQQELDTRVTQRDVENACRGIVQFRIPPTGGVTQKLKNAEGTQWIKLN